MSEVLCHSVNASWSMLYGRFSTDTRVTFDSHECSRSLYAWAHQALCKT